MPFINPDNARMRPAACPRKVESASVTQIAANNRISGQ
jgi:hypothetical protein